MHENEDPQVEKIYELQQENIRLRGQITYLQEELSSVEDELDKTFWSYRMSRTEIKILIISTIMLGLGMMWLGNILGRLGL